MLLVVIIAGVFICLDLLNWLSLFDDWFLDALKIELIVAFDVLIKCIQLIFGPDA